MPGRTAVVIVSYNGAVWIEACLEAVRGQNVADVFVIDNRSTDDTVARVRNGFPECSVLALEQNEGFGRANNRGIQAALDAGADYVCLVNQDAILEPGTLAQLIDVLDRDPAVWIASPIQVRHDADGVDELFFRILPRSFWEDLLFERSQPLYDVPFVPAAAVAIPRRVWLSVGGFDPLFFFYGEDDDLCWRILQGGGRLVFVSAARVRHTQGMLRRSRRSVAWHRNWEYSRLLLYLKQSRRALPYAMLSWVRYGGLPLGPRHLVGRLFALAAAFRESRTIKRHRSGNPFPFADRAAVPTSEKDSAGTPAPRKVP
jgi:GT2 family glycosyltransferase